MLHSINQITGETSNQSGIKTVSDFIEHHYRHFNAASLRDAARGYRGHIENGGQMFLAMAGAMSTAELGISLAEMIREDKLHAICCTGANIEEDVFNLVAHSKYERVSNYRDLTPEDELALLERKMNRVTDTCIPEDDAMDKIEDKIIPLWQEAETSGDRRFPHEFLYELLLSGSLEEHYEVDPSHSWLLAAAQKNLPIFVPGWEDSSLGNIYAACVYDKRLKSPLSVKGGMEYFLELADYYMRVSTEKPIGFFQIGGGIAGDFPICVVPMLTQDADVPDVPLWSYYCQISDSTTSYGSYSGAVPNEKISWGKLSIDTPQFVIESDATIVAPLLFHYVLGH
ncbi:MAG: deoxyhypusine synthase family protein [Verrucomicrobiota bacterium]